MIPIHTQNSEDSAISYKCDYFDKDKQTLNKLNAILVSYGPRQANLVLIAYASSEGSGEPAHPRSLARTFAARSYKQ